MDSFDGSSLAERGERLTDLIGISTDVFDRGAAAFNTQDVEGLVALHTDDAEIVPAGYWLSPPGTSYHGEDGVRSLFTETFSSAPSARIENGPPRAVGAWILVAVTLFETPDTEPVELAALYTLRDDRIERAVGYSSVAEALAASEIPPGDDVGAFELDMLRAVFESAPDGIFLVDDDGRYFDCNEAGARLFGISREEVVNHRWGDFATEADKAMAAALFERLRGDGDFNTHVSIRDVNGVEHPVQVHGRANFIPGRHLVLTHAMEADGAGPREHVLSPREREVLTLLAAGMNAEQAARKLTLSPFTVRTHIRNAKEKLGAHTGAQAIAIALRDREISF